MQTTPPIISAAIIPEVPFNPTEVRMIEDRINVIKVIPLTGFVPTIAIALAATVVNRNEIRRTISNPAKAHPILYTTPI